MDTIGANLQAVRQRIANAAQARGRDPADIGLIAVSKTFGADAVAVARGYGQYAFGESYAQEGVAKIAAAADSALKSRIASAIHEDASSTSDARGPSAGVASPSETGPLLRPLEWHFIGPIQSNKTRMIAEHFDWVHSIERLKIAQRLSAARPAALAPLQVCIQVNIGAEHGKSGVAAGEALALARAVAELPRLKLRGLMAIPPVSLDYAQQRRYFAQLRQLKDALVSAGVALDTLSMGMSDDFEAAIAEGATLVRVGTAIFGPREKTLVTENTADSEKPLES